MSGSPEEILRGAFHEGEPIQVLVENDHLIFSQQAAAEGALQLRAPAPDPEPVDTVMVDGKVVVQGGQLVGVDVERLVAHADATAMALLAAAGRRTGTDYTRKG